MKSLTVKVACSVCGKTLKGTPRMRGLGHNVRPHNGLNGKPCIGKNLGDHKPVK